MRHVLFAVLACAGCVRSTLVECGDLTCPADTTCLADRGVCASPDSLEVCAGQPDGTPCVAPRIDGACDDGLCVASVCGDGVAEGHEQCDGAVTLTCADFRFYDGTLTCTPGCLYDTTACFGVCGDHIVQTEVGEVCDGNLPERDCVQLGYDYGHLQCTALCSDSALLDCDRYDPSVVFAPAIGEMVDILDVVRDGKLLVMSRAASGLVIVDRGVRYDAAGTFGRIAQKAGEIAVAHDGGVDLVIGHALSPLPAIGGLGAGERVSGLAYGTAGTLWAITTGCTVVERVAGAWQPRAAPVATSCEFLAIDSDGVVYTIATTAAGADVRSLSGATWASIPQTGSPRWIGPGRPGRALVSLEGVRIGIHELTATRAFPIGNQDQWFEAAAIGDAYLATSLAPVRLIDGLPPEFFTSVTHYPYHLRRMLDDTVLMWGMEVIEVGRMMLGEQRVRPVQGARFRAGLGFVYWNANVISVLEATGETSYAVTSGPIRDLAITPPIIHALTDGGLSSSEVGKAPTLDPSVKGVRLWIDTAGNLAVLGNDRAVRIRAANQTTLTTLPAGCGLVSALAARSLGDLYVSRVCPTGTVIERWDGTSWTTVYTVQRSLTDATVLGDGTIVFVGERIVMSNGTTWTELAGEAGTASGPSRDDVWFASARTSGIAQYGLLHYDGASLAAVRWPVPAEQPTVVAADPNTAFVASTNRYLLIAQWAVP